MNEQRVKQLACLLVAVLSIHGTVFSSIVRGMLVKTLYGYVPVEKLRVGDDVVTRDCESDDNLVKITDICRRPVTKVYHIQVAGADLYVSGNQLIYNNFLNTWVRADKLSRFDCLLDIKSNIVPCLLVEVVACEDIAYTLSLESPHTFYVTESDVLVHNVVPIVLATLTASKGAALVSYAAAIGIGVWQCFEPIKALFGGTRYHADKDSDAQAPGKPTAADGYEPPKNWDGKKVKNPYGPGYGWPDRKGNVWVPSGPNGHGGPHWDVQKPGGGYDNIVPGGRIRGEK